MREDKTRSARNSGVIAQLRNAVFVRLERKVSRHDLFRASLSNMPAKPFIAAADNNKAPILNVLSGLFSRCSEVLEIGAGTGQHATHFASAMPHLRWQATDLADYVGGINCWISDAGLANLPPARALDVTEEQWVASPVDAMYSANTVHYMAWSAVVSFFAGVRRHLDDTGCFALYGPFNYGGRYISEGNRRLDEWLKLQDPSYAIRDIEALKDCAGDFSLELSEDHGMPANNRLLVWRPI